MRKGKSKKEQKMGEVKGQREKGVPRAHEGHMQSKQVMKVGIEFHVTGEL